MKKILSLVLIIALVLGSFSFAFGLSDIAGQDCEEAVDTLTSLGIVSGYPDGTYKPEKAVKRGEMAKLIVTALGYADLAAGSTSNFNDVAGHWAEEDGFIGMASGLGIINGYPDGSFRPEKVVSYDEAITMVLRALGYNDDALKGSWPTNYKVKALDLGLTDGITLAAGGADRGGIAILLFNALTEKIVFVDADGNIDETDRPLLISKTGSKEDDVTLLPADVVGEDALDSEIDLKPYVFQTVTVYRNDDEAIVSVIEKDNKTLTGEVTTAGAVEIEITEADDDVTTIDTVDADKMFLNGAAASTTEVADIEGADITVVYEGKVGTDVVGIIVELASTPQIIANEFDADDVDDLDGITLPTVKNDDDEDVTDFDNITVVGDASSLEDIAEGDVVYAYESDDTSVLKLEVVRDTAEGTVDEIVSETKVVVDGTTYEYNSAATKFVANDLGDEYKLTLDKDGKIIASEIVTEESDLDNYAIVVDVANGELSSDIWSTTSESKSPKIKLFNSNGEKVVYDVYYDYDADGSSSAAGFTWTETETAIILGGVAEGDLVAFELNSDGEVKEISVIDGSDDVVSSAVISAYDKPVLDGQYIVNSDTLIYNIKGDASYEIADKADLGSSITGIAVYNDNDEVEVLVISDGDISSETTGTYAVVTAVSTVLNDDKDTVNKVVVIIDGVEKTYLTDKDTSATVNETEIVELTFDGDVITAISAEDADVALTTITGINGDFYKFGEAGYKEVSSNAVVYVYDAEDEETTVGSLSDIVKDETQVKGYEVDADQDGLDILFIIK